MKKYRPQGLKAWKVSPPEFTAEWMGRKLSRWQHGGGVKHGGREGREEGKEKKELKTVCKLTQCHVYLIYVIYVKCYICIHVHAQRTWKRVTFVLTSYIH